MIKNIDAKQEVISRNVYVGCGTDRREGYLHCDIRALPGVDIVCKAWELSEHLLDVDSIYSRHMLEHLTSMEAEATLHDWYRALKINGTIHIIVPNLDYHCEQWLKAEWNEETLTNRHSDARWGFAGFYGWQSECNPRSPDYNDSYWDVHKSGYNQKRIKFLLERAGFVNVETEIKKNVHLVAKAHKKMEKGERQVSPHLKGIREDHRNRYEFACNILKKGSPNHILDLACGVGYGSKMLADALSCDIDAVDINKSAIEFGKLNYASSKITYHCADARTIEFEKKFNAIVSFETIEHVEFDRELIEKFYKLLIPGGLLICSTPNQDVLPFDPEKFKFHIRHYTVNEISKIVSNAGFKISNIYTQHDPKNGRVEEGDNGCFTILVCQKPKAESI